MAEAIALIGLASAIVQFLDFGSKVVRQLRRLEVDVAEMPVVFRNVRSRLPLMLDLVRKIGLQMDAGLVRGESQELMLPVIHNCVKQAEKLDGLIRKALPQPNESYFSRGKKAVIGVLAEPDIERIDAALKANFDLLTQARIVQSKGDHDTSSATTFNMSGSTVNVTMVQQEHKELQCHLPLGPPPQHTGHGASRDPSFKPPIFMVPFPRDINFLGRDSTLNLIEQKSKSQGVIALFGLGGVG
jgi:hypothetical protein